MMKLPDPLGVHNNQLRRKLKGDFVVFVKYMFKRWGMPELTFLQLVYCDILQKETYWGVVFLAYRGFSKTLLGNLYLLWLLWKDPTIQVGIWGQNLTFASQSVGQILGWIMNHPEFTAIRPGGKDRQSTHGFDTPQKPAHMHGSNVNALSIGGGITGSRADILLVDDPETQNNGYTQQRRENLDRAMDEAVMVVKQGVGRIRVNGTPHFDRSLYLRLKEKGYKIYIFPMSVPSKEVSDLCWQHYPQQVRELILKGQEGDPLDRFGREEIAMRMSTGKISYERQCLLNLYRSAGTRRVFDITRIILFDAPKDRFPQRLEHAREPQYVDQEAAEYSCADLGERFYRPFKISEEMSPYEHKVAYIDPSGAGRDEMALVVAGVANGYMVVFHVEGLAGLTKENVEHCIDVALDYKVNEILVESNLQAAAQWFRAVMDDKYAPKLGSSQLPPIVPIHQQISKDRRIPDTLDPLINGGRMVLTPSALKMDHRSAAERGTMDFSDYTLTAQISNYSTTDDIPVDDRVDTLAGAGKRLLPWLGITPEKSDRDREYEWVEGLFKHPLEIPGEAKEFWTLKPSTDTRAGFRRGKRGFRK